MPGKSTLYDAIDSHVQRLSDNLYTALPAIVESYDSKKQTVKVKPCLNITTNKGQELLWSSLPDVPVMFPSAGGGIISFPVQKGDNVLLLFSKNSIDTWKAGDGKPVHVKSNRSHSIADAIAIVGLSTPNNNLSPNVDDVEIKFNDQKITLKKDGGVDITTASSITISNGTVEVIDLLVRLIETIEAITVNTMYGPSPINNLTDFTLLKEELDTIKG